MDHTKRCHHCGHHGQGPDEVHKELIDARAGQAAAITDHSALLKRHHALGIRNARLQLAHGHALKAMKHAGMAIPDEAHPENVTITVEAETEES